MRTGELFVETERSERRERIDRCKDTSAPEVMSGPGRDWVILVVEDDEELRTLLADVLSVQGYTVLAAEDAVQAVTLIESTPKVDLVLSDLVMPGLGGQALVEQLKGTHPELKALYMSGYHKNDLLARGMLDPSAAFLAKPFAFENLLDRIRETLALKERRR